MSSRQLRKLQQQRELEEQAKRREAEAEEEESEEESVLSSKPKASLFANLSALEDEQEDEDQDVENEDAEEQQHLSEPEPVPSPATKKPKKPKKKKKGKNKAKETEKSAEKQEHANGPDEIDAALRELNIQKPSKGSFAMITETKLDPEYEKVCALLGVNTQNLKVANEMRNLFGRNATDNHDDAGGPVGRGARRRQRAQQQQVDLETALKGHHAPGKGLSELTLRRNNFIQGKDDWPKGTTGGLAMAVVDDQREVDGTVEFRYVHDKTYQALQQAFYGYVEMGDPQNLIALLTRNPYHISLLIQVSKIAKDQSDHSLSSDLLERALFTFGRAASTLFNTKISQGKARLDFARPENRELWLAGYQYIKSLMMKGTYQTAFEWAKLLLSLDPEGDPYCMGRLMIHQLALRAHKFNWLLDLISSKISKNWIQDSGAIIHMFPSLTFAALQLRDGKKARALLSDNMRTVPWLYTSLFKELNLDAPPSIWGIVSRSEAETLFTSIYISQCKDLWNTPEATALLMEIAHTIPKPNIGSIPKAENSEMTLDVVRFVYLDNNPSIMRLAPSALLHRSNNSDADPLPPDTNVFSYEAQRRAVGGREGPSGLRDDFFDPMAALARLLNRGGDEDTEPLDQYDDRLRRGLENVVANADDSDSEIEGEGHESIMPVSIARRLLNMFWRTELADSDDEEHDEGDFTDTDDEMPELTGEHSDTDDEMPGLIAENIDTDDEMPELIAP